MSARVMTAFGAAILILARPAAMPAQEAAPPAFRALDSLRVTTTSAPLSTPVTLAVADGTRRDVLRAIATQAGVSIVFDAALPGLDDHLAARYSRLPAATALLRALAGSELRALVSPAGDRVVLVPRLREVRAIRRVTGSVRAVEAPVAAARVELVGTAHHATTHDDGSFVMPDVPAGEYLVRVTRLGYRPIQRQPLEVSAERDSRVELMMVREAVPLEAVVVTPGYFGLLEGSASAPQTLTREQLETVPQIGEDIYRAINRLPGVGSSDFSARFSVRGATADQLYVTLDGLRLIEPFHLKDIGSALSIIDIGTLGQASLVSGGASAAFGDEIGGVFEMRSLDPRTERPRTSVGLSLTNVRATSQGAFGDGKGGWLLSGRRGFLDLAFRLASLGDSLRPRYNDVFAKVQYDLPNDGQVALHALHSGDDLRYLDVGEEVIDTKYLANYLWLTLHQPLGTRWTSESVLSAANLDWRRAGQSSLLVSPRALVDDRRSLINLEGREDLSFRATDNLLVTVGADLRHERVDYEYARHASRSVLQSGAIVIVPESLSASIRPRGTSVGLYLSNRLQLLDALTVEAGLRYDASASVSERLLSPRIGAAWELASRTTVRGSWGRYAQSQPAFALSVEDGERSFSPADRSEQAEVGVEQGIGAGMTARVNVYRRLLWSARPRYVNATAAISPFPEIAYDRVLVPPSTGRAEGIEASVGHGAGGLVEWSASYALASATDRIAGRDVPRVTDQRHTAHLDWSYHPASNAWRLAVAGIWHTGTPDTPDVVRVDTLIDTPTQLTLNAQWTPGLLYSDRVPAYKRVDIRWTRYFITSRGRISVFGELFNALDAENLRGYTTNLDINNRRVALVRATRTQLPRLPSFGFTWEF